MFMPSTGFCVVVACVVDDLIQGERANLLRMRTEKDEDQRERERPEEGDRGGEGHDGGGGGGDGERRAEELTNRVGDGKGAAERVDDPRTATGGGGDTGQGSCKPEGEVKGEVTSMPSEPTTPALPATPPPPPSPGLEPFGLAINGSVSISGLVSEASSKYNGLIGKVVADLDEKGFVRVWVPERAKHVKVRPKNITKVDAEPTEPAAAVVEAVVGAVVEAVVEAKVREGDGEEGAADRHQENQDEDGSLLPKPRRRHFLIHFIFAVSSTPQHPLAPHNPGQRITLAPEHNHRPCVPTQRISPNVTEHRRTSPNIARRCPAVCSCACSSAPSWPSRGRPTSRLAAGSTDARCGSPRSVRNQTMASLT